VFAGLVLGDRNLALLWPNRVPDWWVWLVPIALLAALTVVWARSPRIEILALLLALLGGWALALWTLWALPDPLRVLWSFGGRYFLVPTAVLYVSLAVSVPTGTLRKSIAALACLLLIAGIVRGYRIAPLAPVDWAPFAACVEKGTTPCETVIPPGWTLEVTPPGR
jgi:hypothetical protein